MQDGRFDLSRHNDARGGCMRDIERSPIGRGTTDALLCLRENIQLLQSSICMWLACERRPPTKPRRQSFSAFVGNGPHLHPDWTYMYCGNININIDIDNSESQCTPGHGTHSRPSTHHDNRTAALLAGRADRPRDGWYSRHRSKYGSRSG